MSKFKPELTNRDRIENAERRSIQFCTQTSLYDRQFHARRQLSFGYVIMLGGLNEITALELFTKNYLIWGRISFTIWKRIEFYVYPPGARLSRPPHRYAQGPYFFCEIAGLTRVRPAKFLAKECAGQTRILKNTFILTWGTGTHLQL